jgi:hypothetical protein
MTKRILIFSIAADIHVDRVISQLPTSVEAIRLNLDDPTKWALSYLNGDVRVKIGSDTFGLEEVLSVFVRRIPDLYSFKKMVPSQYVQYEEYIAHQQFCLFSDCLAILDATKPFVNPLASASRAGKAVQAKLALSIGLLTPETYMGADPAIARSFTDKLFSQDKQACSKPIQSKKFRIGNEERTKYTELLVPPVEDSLKSLEPCPVIFQEYIPKAYEIRATVIGDQTFAARIGSKT